ncbi:MAG: ribonuclease III [Rhizobiales bacterium]|nr:ribonuclease III [Hyphomicrobiales bacterium]MBA70605.1 ribonuclease III [Hyphomicrobiales bacterium]|tara:strand:+ start:1464 stop:2174 length:711 start_codon:yes stop_codon:yes gene_type:complete
MSGRKGGRTDDVAAIGERIGHRFSDIERVSRALTHSSLREGGNYERLEFLGDRVLGLVVAELLFSNFKEADEGELSVRLNQLVSAKTCAEVADELGLHEFIRTGADVKKLTGKRMANVRADVVESLIAAIYLEGGLEAARKFIEANWTRRALDSGAARRDAKTELQEWAHQKFGVTPVYKITGRAGPDHDPVFTVSVEIKGTGAGSGQSRSKRAAEQEAATEVLVREGVWPGAGEK